MIVTGIGSLPHGDPAAAARFVADSTDLPYLAQLPLRHPEEGMVRQWGDGLCGCGAVDTGVGLRFGSPSGPRHEAFVGAAAVLASGGAGPVKTQLTGPVTMAVAMRSAGHPVEGLWDCVVGGLLDRLDEHLAWIGSAVGGLSVHVVVDEPGLAAMRGRGSMDAVSALRHFFAASPMPLGLHCCADTDWSLVASLRPAVISWDVETLGGGFGGAEDALAGAISSGCGIAWGVVPTRPGPVVGLGSARARYGTAVARLALAGAPVHRLTTDAWVTPACGMAGLTEDGAAAVAARVREFAEVEHA